MGGQDRRGKANSIAISLFLSHTLTLNFLDDATKKKVPYLTRTPTPTPTPVTLSRAPPLIKHRLFKALEVRLTRSGLVRPKRIESITSCGLRSCLFLGDGETFACPGQLSSLLTLLTLLTLLSRQGFAVACAIASRPVATQLAVHTSPVTPQS